MPSVRGDFFLAASAPRLRITGYDHRMTASVQFPLDTTKPLVTAKRTHQTQRAKQKAPAGDASAGLGWLSLVSPDQPFLHFLPHADLSVTSGQVLTQKHHLIHVLAGRINALRKKNNCRNMVLQPVSDWKNSYHSCEITALLTASRHEE